MTSSATRVAWWVASYIQLARHNVDPRRNGGGDKGYQIPSACKKRMLSRLNLVPVITANLPVDPTVGGCTS